MHDLEIALDASQTEQKRIVEDVLRTNAFASDSNAEMALRINKSNEMYEEANL